MVGARSAALGVGLFVLALPVSAAATTICVPAHHAACPNNGTNVAVANLETALGTDGTDGTADTVIVDAGTFTDTNSFTPSGTDSLVLQGAGPAATRLTSSSTADLTVLDLGVGNARSVTVRDLTVAAPASFPDGDGGMMTVSSDVLENVDLVSLNAGSEAIRSIAGTLTYRAGTIRGEAGGDVAPGITATSSATTVTLDRLTLNSVLNAIGLNGPGTMNITRSRLVEPIQGAIAATDGTINVENTVIDGSSATPLIAFSYSATSEPVTVNADHVTMRRADDMSSAVRVEVQAGGAFDAEANVSNSIIRGFGFPYSRSAPAASMDGDAGISIRYSNFDPTNVSEIGDGTTDVATANINADPLFVSATDLALQAGSPSIDAGDPAAAIPVGDFLGLPRPVDGNADGSAVRDQGAYELQVEAPAADTDAPETTLTKKPKRKTTKRKAKFGFEADEPGSSFECRLDKQEFTPCETPLKTKKLKRRKHNFLVRAIDASGNVDPTPAKAKFKVKRPG